MLSFILNILLIWYIVLSVFFLIAILSNNVIYNYKNGKLLNTRQGSTLLHLITSMLFVVSPIITEKNSMTFFDDFIFKNIYSSTYILILLVVACVSIALAIKEFDESVSFGIFLTFIAFSCVIAVVIILLFFIPLNLPDCKCKDNYYGTDCELTCFTSTNVVCSGHGTCSDDGCICDQKFKGESCNQCINKYSYETNCSTCVRGYSYINDCTECEDGRDKTNDCQTCLSSYYVDPNNIFNVDSCTVCKPFYYKPSSSIERGSYNEFLQFGESCQPCKTDSNGNVCNGHGICKHFWTETNEGTFYEGLSNTTILGLEANGDCVCDVGYAAGEAGTCERIPGYDFENPESICNGHGEPFVLYKQEPNAIYSIFDKLVCKCDLNYYPSFTNSHNSCSQNMLDDTCIYGYWKNDTTCEPCNGGGFLQGCNSGRGAGICLNDGTCECYTSYNPNSGGYTGDDCKTCANRNFYKIKNSKAYKDNPSLFDDPEKCQPCVGAISEDIVDSCGLGYCITEILLDEFRNDNNLFQTFQLATGYLDSISYQRLHMIGTCICYNTKSINPINGLCE